MVHDVTVSSFEDHAFALLVDALSGVESVEAAQVYVVSLFVYDEDDDPRYPTVTVGYNTDERFRETSPAAGQRAGWPIASDAQEARWNYAFWLQNELAILCGGERDPQGAALHRAWIDRLGLWYSDEEEEHDFDAVGHRADRITDEFVALAVRVVKRLHSAGVVERAFGRAVPVLIHELEYDEDIVRQNEEANPPGLIDDFKHWVLGSAGGAARE